MGLVRDTAWRRFWSSRSAQPDDIYPTSPAFSMRVAAHGEGPFLELGCGTARDSVRLASQGLRVVALDRERSALALARHFAQAAGVILPLVCADVAHLPFRDNSFGTVFHQGLLEHFRDPHPLLQETLRVVRPGGTLVLEVPQTFHPWTVLKRVLIPLGLWFAGWETQFTPRKLVRTVTREGFVVQHVFGEWMHPSLAYRLLREVGRRTGVWRLPLYPRLPSLHGLAHTIDQRLFGGILQRWTGHSVGLVAKRPPVATDGQDARPRPTALNPGGKA